MRYLGVLSVQLALQRGQFSTLPGDLGLLVSHPSAMDQPSVVKVEHKKPRVKEVIA